MRPILQSMIKPALRCKAAVVERVDVAGRVKFARFDHDLHEIFKRRGVERRIGPQASILR